MCRPKWGDEQQMISLEMVCELKYRRRLPFFLLSFNSIKMSLHEASRCTLRPLRDHRMATWHLLSCRGNIR